MAKVTITNPAPFRGGRKVHGMDGRARPRCRICGRAVYGRNARTCRDCLATGGRATPPADMAARAVKGGAA